MSLYYVVKLFQDDPRIQPDYLGPRRDGRRQAPGEPLPLGVVGMQEAKRFLWKEEADAALHRFMIEHGGDRIVRGQVFHVKETAADIPMTATGEPPAPPPPPEPIPSDSGLDIGIGEGLWRDYLSSENGSEDDASLLVWTREWFFDNADTIFKLLRERDRLDWLRKNPEGCRAEKDCRNKRAKGYIHCEACLEDGNAGGYFDVYQRYYADLYNDAFTEILARLNSLAPPDPAAPPPPG